MNDLEQRYFLSRFADLQKDEKLPICRCPRCGLAKMKKPIYTNALSRHADIYVCDLCGIEEALMDMNHTQLPLEEWYLIKLLISE